MQIRTCLIDPRDGSEHDKWEGPIAEAFPDLEERAHVIAELDKSGRCWVGGGAAPLVIVYDLRRRWL